MKTIKILQTVSIYACIWLGFGGFPRAQAAPSVDSMVIMDHRSDWATDPKGTRPEFVEEILDEVLRGGESPTEDGGAQPPSGSVSVGSLALIESFSAIPYTGWTPPDPIIAAGPASLVAMVNQQIAIYDKKGTKLFQQSLASSTGFWRAQKASSSVGDPWVIYDPNANRFIAIAADFGSKIGFLYLAISKSSTPIASADWYKYALNLKGSHMDPNFAGQATFPDYPKLGVDGDAIYITANHFGINAGGYSHAQILAIKKEPLLSGGAVTELYEDNIPRPYISIHPAVVHEPAPAMYFVNAFPPAGSQTVDVHVLENVLTASPSRKAWSVPVAAYNQPLDVPQLDGGVPLDSVGSRIMSGVVRNGSLWTSHAIQDPAVDAEAVVRWYEIEIPLPESGPTLVQSGNVDPGPNIHTWMSHINVDAAGNMGIGFSVGGPNQYADIGYTGRLASDPLGTTRPVQTARLGEGNYQIVAGDGRNRWGDYSGLAIDPDGCTFWLFHEYPTAANRWQTFAGAFQVDPCPKSEIAADGFESGTFSGGSGNWFELAWSPSGDISILNSSGPAEGSRHVRLRSNTGMLQRAARVSGAANLQLSFWAKVNSLESSDRAYVKVSADGVNFSTVWTFASAASDSLYHYYPIDLTSFLTGSDIVYIAFDAEMSAANDNWYVDDIHLTGNMAPVANAGPDQIVSDNDGGGSEILTLDASSSFDPEGSIVAYEWTESGNSLGNTPLLNVNVAVGTWTVTLAVTDNEGATSTDTIQLTVNPIEP